MGKRFLALLPNLITIMRLVLIAPIVVAFSYQEYRLGFVLFFIAAGSDAVDGFLARYYHTESRFGSIADPIADKLLMSASFLVLTLQGHIPFWLFVLVVARDLVIVTGSYVIHRRYGSFKVQPTYLSKFNTFFQSLYVVVLITHLAFLLIDNNWIELLAWITGLITAISGIHYIWLWLTKIKNLNKDNPV